MCLAIPAEIVELVDPERQLATVDIAGVRRKVNVGLVKDDGIAPGDWVLVHVGFAMAKIDEEEARLTLETLRMLGTAYGDELSAVRGSQIT